MKMDFDSIFIYTKFKMSVSQATKLALSFQNVHTDTCENEMLCTTSQNYHRQASEGIVSSEHFAQFARTAITTEVARQVQIPEEYMYIYIKRGSFNYSFAKENFVKQIGEEIQRRAAHIFFHFAKNGPFLFTQEIVSLPCQAERDDLSAKYHTLLWHCCFLFT